MPWKDLLKSRTSPYREKPFDDAKPELPSPQDDIRPPSPDRVSVMEVVEDLLREEGGAADFDKIFEAVENKASNIVSRKEVMAILEYDPDVAQLEDGDYILVNTIEKNWQDILQKEGKKDACYYKVKSRYKKWPSAYGSGALVQCREVGADNCGNSVEKSADDILKQSYMSNMKEFAKHIKSYYIDNRKAVVNRYKNELKQVQKRIKEIEKYVKENQLGTIRYNEVMTSIAIKDKDLENELIELIDKEKKLYRKLQRYYSIDEKLETFNDPAKLTEYAKNRYGIDLTEPKTLELFMETMKLEGMTPVEGAVKLTSSAGQKKNEINLTLLQQAVNVLASMNREAPSKQEVAEEMEIDINQQWDYRADEAYKKAIQLLRQRGKI